MKRILTSVVLLAACAVLTLAAAAEARTFRFDYHKEMAIQPGAALRVHNSAGNVTVTGEPGLDHIVIQAVKTVHAVDESAAREVAGFINLKLSSNDNETRIETIVEKVEQQQRSFWQRLVGTEDDWFESVDYIIQAPTEVNVMIIGATGDLDISGVTGNLDISISSSTLTLANITGDILLDLTAGELTAREIHGSLEITSTRANVGVTSLIGDLTIHGGSGSLTGEFVEGAVNVVQTSGDVTLHDLRGDARIKVTSGVIDVQQENGSLDLFAHTGSITVKTELFGQREFMAETLSGPITFTFPDNTGATVKLTTLSGEIKTEGLPMELATFSRQEISGAIAGGGVKLTLKSDAGDITLGWY